MEFIHNKYLQWYNRIIANAQKRLIGDDVYTESHHIIPRSLGGNNAKSNIVDLLAREHFVCHLLLTKFTVGDQKRKMDHAAFMLTVSSKNQQRYKITSRQYQILRENYSAAKRGVPTGPRPESVGANISKAKKGKPLTDEHKKALTGIKKGRPWSDARRKAGRQVMTPFGVFDSFSEAERQLKLGANVIAYRVKTQSDKYYIIK